jgi:hypothetical protein
MEGKKPFFVLLVLSAACALLSAGLHAQLIEPTRGIEGTSDGTGILNALSEPPGLDVQLDGRLIGKTPIFSLRRHPGLHLLRIKDSETEIRLVAGKSLTITLFKDSFIEIPTETVKPFSEITKEPLIPPTKSKTDEGSGVRQRITKDPYYWPLNPRGPIY